MSPEQLLGSLEATGHTVVADFEAGIGTLSRLDAASVDVVLVVVEATAKSIEVASRAAGLAREKSLGRVIVVANRVGDDGEWLRASFPDAEVVLVPEDPRIWEADRTGVAPLDRAPDSPGVSALIGLSQRLLAS